MLFTATDDDDEITQYSDLVGRWALDGFLLTSTHPGDSRTAHLSRTGTPCVTFGRPWDGTDHHPWVDVDGAAGTHMATEHLIDRGHRDIGFLGWPAGSAAGTTDAAAGARRCAPQGYRRRNPAAAGTT